MTPRSNALVRPKLQLELRRAFGACPTALKAHRVISVFVARRPREFSVLFFLLLCREHELPSPRRRRRVDGVPTVLRAQVRRNGTDMWMKDQYLDILFRWLYLPLYILFASFSLNF